MSSNSTASSSTATKAVATSAGDKKPAAKRKRVSRACDQCFLKKDRCDGLQPICTFCHQLDRTCTYDRPERKRGPTQGLRPRLEQRILALETILGFVFSTTTTTNTTTSASSSNSQFQNHGDKTVRLGNVDLDLGRLGSSTEEEKKEWREAGWRRSSVRKEFEQVLNGLLDDDDELVSSSTTITLSTTNDDKNINDVDVKHSASSSSSKHKQDHNVEEEQEGGEGGGYHSDTSDYSDLDLSLPPSHNPPPSSSSRHNNKNNSNNHDTHSSHSSPNSSPILPLLSSGKGGSSLNRGLVPRGLDPNAALGGFEIEFGGNQTDEDWVRRFVPPSSSSNSNSNSNSNNSNRHGGGQGGSSRRDGSHP